MIRWNPNFAYAIGLIATDGSLSKDGRHIDFTSKDLEQIQNFIGILGLTNKIGTKTNGHSEKRYYYVQFGNVQLYKFLLKIGLTPNKSKTIAKILVPKKYFQDFLRGHLDGDGNIYLAKHPESQHLQLRVRFSSASMNHLEWIKNCITDYFEILGGHFYKITNKNVSYISFAKNDSLRLLDLMYYDGVEYYLHRKYDIISKLLGEWRNWHTRTI